MRGFVDGYFKRSPHRGEPQTADGKYPAQTITPMVGKYGKNVPATLRLVLSPPITVLAHHSRCPVIGRSYQPPGEEAFYPESAREANSFANVIQS